jgi:hypothetical protein
LAGPELSGGSSNIQVARCGATILCCYQQTWAKFPPLLDCLAQLITRDGIFLVAPTIFLPWRRRHAFDVARDSSCKKNGHLALRRIEPVGTTFASDMTGGEKFREMTFMDLPLRAA